MLEREAKDVSLIPEGTVAVGGLVTHIGEDISGYSKKELIVKSSGNATVYVQFSNDLENWYTWYDVQDVLVYFTCDTNKKAWEIIDHSHYIRILIYNADSSSITVSANLMCQV